MTGGSDTQSKLRAAILAFVMVTSMMVGTVALTGTAAADVGAISNAELTDLEANINGVQQVFRADIDTASDTTTITIDIDKGGDDDVAKSVISAKAVTDIGTGSDLTVSNPSTNSNGEVKVDVSSSDGTGSTDGTLVVRYSVDTTNSGGDLDFTSSTGSNAARITATGVSGQDVSYEIDSNGEGPQIESAETLDEGPSGGSPLEDGSTTGTADNGKVDAVVVTFDKAVKDTSVDHEDFQLDSTDTGSGSDETASGVTTGDTRLEGGITDDDKLVMEIPEDDGSNFFGTGTGIDPLIDYQTNGAGDDILQTAGTGSDASNSNQEATDTAEPAITDAQTADTNNDGSIDQITAVMSESIDDSAADSDDDEFTGQGAVSIASTDLGSGSTDDSNVVLTLASSVSGTGPLDNADNTITQVGGEVTDTSSNTQASDVTQDTSDNAKPIITDYRGTTGSNTATVTFSEDVESVGGGPIVAGDLIHNQNSGDGASSILSVSNNDGNDDTRTVTLDSDILSSDINQDTIDDDNGFRDTSANNNDGQGLARTLKQSTLANDPGSGGINFELADQNGDDSADVVVGSADEDIGELKLEDKPGDDSEAFAGTTDITFGSGVTINESASDLSTNTVITSANDGVSIDSVNVVNNSNTIEIQHSGTSTSGERIRISSGAIHLSVDGDGVDTTGKSNTLDVTVETFSGKATLSGALTAVSPTSSNGGGVTVPAGSSNIDNGGLGGSTPPTYSDGNEEVTIAQGDLEAAIETTDTALVGNQTSIVYSLEGTGVSFDTDNTGSNLMKNSLDIDDDGTDEIDESEISVSSGQIAVPIVDSLDAGSVDTDITLHNVVFETTGSATDTDLNVTVTSPSPSVDPYVIDSNDGSVTSSDYVTVESPDVNIDPNSLDQLSVGQNQQYLSQDAGGLRTDQAALIEIEDTSGGQLAAGENITVRLNSSFVTFDTSQDDQVQVNSDSQITADTDNDPAFGINRNGGSTSVGDATIREDRIEISITDDNSNDGDIIEIDDVALNVSTDAPDDERVRVEVVTKPSSDSPDVVSTSTDAKTDGPTTNQFFTLQRPNIELPSSDANTEKNFDANTNSNITFDVDGDGFTQQNPIGDSNTNALIINSNDVGQIADDTNVTISLEEGTGITFDTTASTGTNANNPGDTTVEVDVEGSLDADRVAVSEKSIDIVLNDDNSDGGPDAALNTGTGNEIVLDDFVLNVTGDASPTEISVTTNATVSDRDQAGIAADSNNGVFTSSADNEATTTLDVLLKPDTVNASEISVDPDTSNNGKDPGNFAKGEDQQVDKPTVDNAITGAVEVSDGSTVFGGAEVSLEIVETPEGSSGSALNTTVVTTDQNGQAAFNFTAGDTAGDYVVNASIAGASGGNSGVNVTYTAQPGSIDSVTVSPIENAIASQGQGVSELGVAAFYVNATDANGNPVDASGTVDITTDDVNADQIQVVSDRDPDGSTDSVSGSFSGSFSLDGSDGSSVVEIGNINDPKDVTIEAELSGSSDTGTVTFFDNVGQVGLSLNTTSAAVDDRVAANTTISESDGTTIEVPDVPVTIDDGSSGNTTFDGDADSVSVTTDSSGVATATITAEQTGSADITANTNLRQTTETLTISESQADFQLELVDGPTSVTAGENYTATVNVSNVGNASGTQAVDYALEAADGNTPITDSKDVSLDADSSTEIEFNVSSSETGSIATGNFTHVVSTAGADDATLNVTIQEAADEPVDRFDTNGEPGIQSGEVLNAISAFNEDTRIGGEPVESGDVLDVISAFNEA